MSQANPCKQPRCYWCRPRRKARAWPVLALMLLYLSIGLAARRWPTAWPVDVATFSEANDCED